MWRKNWGLRRRRFRPGNEASTNRPTATIQPSLNSLGMCLSPKTERLAGRHVGFDRALAGIRRSLPHRPDCEPCTIWRWESNQPFDQRRWSRGIVALQKRLAKLGLSELTADVARTLNR